MENSGAEKPPEEERANTKKHAQGALDRIRTISAAARDKFSNLGWNGRLLVSIVAGIFVALLLFWIVAKIFYYYLVRSYVDQIASVFDLNKHLVNALILLTFIAAVFFGNLIWSFSKQKRLIGIAGIATLLVAHSLVLYFGARDKFFGRSGAAIKCYVVTRNGTVTYGEQPGVDSATGRQCRPVTPEMVERLEEYKKGKLPQRISEADPTFFLRERGSRSFGIINQNRKGSKFLT